MAPPYITVNGLTKSELLPEKCPDGILAREVHGLYKGGGDLFNTVTGWIVFLCADKKDGQDSHLSIANKKFMDHNKRVLLPFIWSICEQLGVPSFESLMGTCKRWNSSSSKLSTMKHVKNLCRKVFQPLMKKQLEAGQITYPDMKEVNIPIPEHNSHFGSLLCVELFSLKLCLRYGYHWFKISTWMELKYRLIILPVQMQSTISQRR